MLSSSVRSIPRTSVCDNFLIKPLCVIARAFIADEIGRKRGTGDREKILRRGKRMRENGKEPGISCPRLLRPYLLGM